MSEQQQTEQNTARASMPKGRGPAKAPTAKPATTVIVCSKLPHDLELQITEFKEVRLKPKIGQGDFDTKVRRAIEFLEDGDRIKVAVQFRGRELTHPHLGRELLAKFADQIKDHGVLERAPLLEGKSMHITIASTHKPRPREATGGASAPDGTPQADEVEGAAPAAAVDAAGSLPAAPAGE